VTAELYWISKSVVLDWALTKLDGTPASDATVTATITLPPIPGGTASPSATWIALANVWRVVYDPPAAGTYTWRLAATGTADSAEEGDFYVKPSPASAGPVTLDPTTTIGQARLLIPDLDEDNLIFTDAQIAGFLSLELANVRLAAAQALDVIASNEAMISKVIRTQDLTTDGTKVAAELRARATGLREQAAEGYGDTTGGFDIADFDPYAGLTNRELAERGYLWDWG
jgi:hypothetical protein